MDIEATYLDLMGLGPRTDDDNRLRGGRFQDPSAEPKRFSMAFQ
jgi:hypothetical protein